MNQNEIEKDIEKVIEAFEQKFQTTYPPEFRQEVRGLLWDLAEEFPPDDDGDGAHLIMHERGRQRSEEGWSSSHDDQHKVGELAMAGMSYTIAAVLQTTCGIEENVTYPPQSFWPWDRKWWKPADRIRNLVKAGALIAAEIDRLQRLEIASGEVQERPRNDISEKGAV